jgi:integrase
MAKLPSCYSIHSLRHSIAMLKAKNNKSPIKIMLWHRHRSVSSTQRYFEQVAFENEAEQMNQLKSRYLQQSQLMGELIN